MYYNDWRKILYIEYPKTTFIINKKLSCNSKNVVYVIECRKCKKVYFVLIETLNNWVSLHKSNIKWPENRKLCFKTPLRMQ